MGGLERGEGRRLSVTCGCCGPIRSAAVARTGICTLKEEKSFRGESLRKKARHRETRRFGVAAASRIKDAKGGGWMILTAEGKRGGGCKRKK